MDFFDKEMYEKGLDFQKNMMNQYMDAINNFTNFFQGKSEDSTKEKDLFETAKDSAEQVMKNAGEMSKFLWNSYQDAWKKWMTAYPDASMRDNIIFSNTSDVMSRLFDSMEVYTKLFDFWKECFEDAKDGISDPFASAANYMEKSEKLMRELSEHVLKPVMSEDAFSAMESYASLVKSVNTAYGDFLTPWISRKDDFLECIRKASTGDRESCSRYVSLMTEAYQESYGKLFRISGVGINKDKVELSLKMLDSYVNMMLSYFGIAVGFQNILRDANTELWEKTRDLMTNSEEPVTFKAFYDMWIRVNSAAINKFYFTDDFTAFMGEYANRAYDFKIKSDEMMESVLSLLPIPTNSEMKSVYKTVYGLRKDVRDLKKEIEALHAEIESLKQNTEE